MDFNVWVSCLSLGTFSIALQGTHIHKHSSNMEASQCQCARDNDDDDGCNDDKRALSIFMKNV